ncbi:hypothetical protein CC80DRAFT_597913 [Byssothecium circinans]|uniref:Uncharacterized protein n=1 Tax=Byssothecium circinans TaxID=147558 RepID=A0A6A5TFC2_9PLEO|nr:hypothetical protein CC80DRAFT_599326 [Byssothecium circinans]KAF1950844.1 hypothetical protein CC80DRAFT_597913 [Byssothecium circinans]
MSFINTHADGVVAGNTLLCLPLELRQEIFAYAALSHIKQHNPSGRIDASDILQGRQCTWLPPMCLVNDKFYVESLPMMLRHADLVINKSYAAYNLNFFLQATNMYPYIHSLQFNTSHAFPPLSAGANLLRECINLRSVWLSFHVREFFQDETSQRNTRAMQEFNRKAFAENYAFRELLSLKKLETVTLFLIDEPIWNIPTGTDSCWGMRAWLQKKFAGRGVNVHVECKVVSEIELEMDGWEM